MRGWWRYFLFLLLIHYFNQKIYEPKVRAGFNLGLGAKPEDAELQKKLKRMERKGVDISGASEKAYERGKLVSLLSGQNEGSYAVIKDYDSGQVFT